MPHASKTTFLNERLSQRNTPPRLRFRKVTCFDRDAGSTVMTIGGGPSEEVIISKVPLPAEARFGTRGSSPQKLPKPPDVSQSSLPMTSQTCTIGTVLESGNICKRNPMFDCGETVQYESCLWKQEENRRQIFLGFGFPGSTGPSAFPTPKLTTYE